MLVLIFFKQACQLKTETITYEEKEQQLVNDCVKELSMFLLFLCYVARPFGCKVFVLSFLKFCHVSMWHYQGGVQPL